MTGGGHETVVRLDAWLWAARFYKTRARAKQAIVNGRIAIDGAACKPSRPVHAGDRLTITRGEERFEIDVLTLAEKRGSAAVAQTLYGESEASRTARDALREQKRAERAGYRAPSGKPDKRARRLIRALGDIEAM
ncbi:MAG: RNA-binding S4 domain-containing protein [Rhodanobacteraceae bacterium]|nr:RNA-binding S4 domain-containing protein [Pseudomonadota bacterium]